MLEFLFCALRMYDYAIYRESSYVLPNNRQFYAERIIGPCVYLKNVIINKNKYLRIILPFFSDAQIYHYYGNYVKCITKMTNKPNNNLRRDIPSFKPSSIAKIDKNGKSLINVLIPATEQN